MTVIVLFLGIKARKRAKIRPNLVYRELYVLSYGSKGDHAGSDAAPGVGTRRKFVPVRSTDQISFFPPLPRVSRENKMTRPLGDHVGPSSR